MHTAMIAKMPVFVTVAAIHIARIVNSVGIVMNAAVDCVKIA